MNQVLRGTLKRLDKVVAPVAREEFDDTDSGLSKRRTVTTTMWCSKEDQ